MILRGWSILKPNIDLIPGMQEKIDSIDAKVKIINKDIDSLSDIEKKIDDILDILEGKK